MVKKACQDETIAFTYEDDLVITEGDIIKDIKSKLIADGLTEKQAIETIWRDIVNR